MPTADKRKRDDMLSLVPASKRTKNEVVFSSREKAVVQNVSVTLIYIKITKNKKYILLFNFLY